MKHEGWGDADRLGVTLDERQINRLEAYERLLAKHALPMGMIARSDGPRIRERHILDCLRAAPLIERDAGIGCDMGSGAGLPGIPIAIVRPELRLALVEVRRTRAAFLERAASELDLVNVTIHARRLETYRERVDVCFARAFADAHAAWNAASRVLTDDGRLVYWAGERFSVDTDIPEGVSTDLFPNAALARSGPLVIMSAQ